MRGDALLGRDLRSLLARSHRDPLRTLIALQDDGHARCELHLGGADASEPVEAYLVLVERPHAGASAEPLGQRLPGVVEAAPLPMLGLSADLRVAVANAAARGLLGERAHGLICSPIVSIFADAAEGVRFEDALAARRANARWPARIDTGAGTRWLDLLPQPVYGGLEQPIGWVVWLRDPATDAPTVGGDPPLARSVRDVVHDLRNPLGAVRGFARMLQRECAATLGQAGLGYLQRVVANLDRVESMVESLSELARPQATSLSSRQWIAPGEVFRALGAELKPELESRGVDLVFQEDPPALWADPARFRQVALNLVTNAVQHMGPAAELRVEVRVESGSVEDTLEVRDRGRGLPPDDRARIAGLFARGASPAGCRHPGLGLVIVQRIMEAHGGRAQVESAPGEGCTFRCAFPHPR